MSDSFSIVSARYANAAGDCVLATRANGSVWVMTPGDPELDGVEIAPFAATEPVPVAVARAQARQAMAAAQLPDGRSLLKATKAAIAAALTATERLPDNDERSVAAEQTSEWWENAATYRRDHPALNALAQQLGLDDVAIDALFRAAATID